MLLSSLADDGYLALDGVLVVTDGPGVDAGGAGASEAGASGPGLDADLLAEAALVMQPGGTVAQAGAGWLWGRAGQADSYHVVRLEAHDAAPHDDLGDWAEVLETPYWSFSGTAGLSMLAGAWDDEAEAVVLGGPGPYRVRVSCVRDFGGDSGDSGGDAEAESTEAGDSWRLQFWPAPGEIEPPRWLARREQPDDGALLATDLVAVALWTRGGAAGTVGELAARVLAQPDEVRAGLRTAIAEGWLLVTGDPADPAAPLTLMAKPPPTTEPRSSPLTLEPLAPPFAPAPVGAEARRQLFLEGGPPAPLPAGPPPRAGIITANRELVAWRDGVPEVLATVEQYTEAALATPHGIVVIGSKRAVLIRPGGAQVVLTPDPDHRTALSEDGRHLAIASHTLGRRPRFRLYLADLADGSAQVLDCPDWLEVQSLRGGQVTCSLSDGQGHAAFSWSPGREPEPVPYRDHLVDRITGTVLSEAEPREFLAGDYVITGPDGRSLTVGRLRDAQQSRLSPGARWLYDFWYDPPELIVTDVGGPAPGPTVTWPVPRNCDTQPGVARGPVWEDETRILVSARNSPDARAVRIDVTTGATERLDLARHGWGAPGQHEDGAEFDVENFVEPFRPAAPAR
ncbi:MAG TPA: hypothetical protein VFX25_31375 [Streptosporangiaceae bacterium]|nr:hypothetical protein [Streptosporangiaceae bacterium]